MKRTALSLLALSFLSMWSCQKDDYEIHESNGIIINKSFDLPEINSILVDAKCTLIIKEGEQQDVQIKVSENIINDIDLKVVNGHWNIDYKEDGIATYNNHEFTIELTNSSLKSITMESSGQVYSEGYLKSSPLKITHNSSGSMQINCQSDNLKVYMDGSGQLSLAGEVQKSNITHDSSGQIKAYSLKSDTCYINHDGSGDAEINVQKHLTANLMGSGHIYYKGNPEIVLSSDGSGSLINKN